MAQLKLESWVIYDRPLDFPEEVVARKWLLTGAGSEPTLDLIRAKSIAEIRPQMIGMGLYCLPRFEQDDPKILEVWL